MFKIITLSDREKKLRIEWYNKKAVLSQRWPRNAPYMVPWKCSWLPDYAHG